MLNITEKTEPNKPPVLILEGEVDVYTAPNFHEKLQEVTNSIENYTFIVLNFENVSYIDIVLTTIDL